MIDLAGKTLLPGFVDAHSHFSQVGVQAISANLLPPPDGPATPIAQIQTILREFMASAPSVKDYGVLIGFDYDDSQLTERRHPTRKELDAVSTEIVVIHQSGHLDVSTVARWRSPASAQLPRIRLAAFTAKQTAKFPTACWMRTRTSRLY